jgi:acyl-CoA reductase-like NAD-dependent aldehyde dehydrogenase
MPTPSHTPETRAFTHTIDGKGESSPKSFDVINPALDEPFAKCPDATKEQLDRAVQAARRAFKNWSKLSFGERREYLHKMSKALAEKANDIAVVLTKEQGKPLSNAQFEMNIAAHEFEAFSDIEVKNETLRVDKTHRVELIYHPMGVVGGIAPWNFPIVLGTHKIAQALYTGNTMVLKPSPFTPLATLMLGEVAREVLPAGVLNVVAGGNELGRWMTEHPGIDRITFTGSTATGKKVMASAADSLKRVTLELGGNDPAILLDDADLDEMMPRVFMGAFMNCGQICMAVKRVFVPEQHYDTVVNGFTKMAQNLKVGDGFEPDVQMGPLQNKMQFEKVLDIIEDTRKQPATRITTGGHRLNRPGYFIAPTIVADIKDDTRLVREEQFGPVLPVLKYKTVDEAIERANNTEYGLCASVWTKDVNKGAKVAEQIQAGTVWVNHHVGSEADLPFGGFKQSGVGRELGLMGLHTFMESQVIKVPLQ